VIRQCAWCRRVIGHKRPFENTAVTHSVCDACARALLRDRDANAKPEPEVSPTNDRITAADAVVARNFEI
jgi:hypothetical protein